MIGRVVSGRPKIEFFDKRVEISVIVQNQSSGEDFEIECDQRGIVCNFFVSLPPGQYSISEVKKGNLVSKPTGRFTVGSGQLIYIGTLRFLDAGLGPSLLASMTSNRSQVVGNWIVEDEYSVAVVIFRERYPHLSQEIAKSLITQ